MASSFRARPIASERRRRQRVEEPIIEEPEQPEVSENEDEEVEEDEKDNGEEMVGPTDHSILKSFQTHVAKFIWNGDDRLPLKCLSHGQKVKMWYLNKSDLFRQKIDRSGLAPLIRTSYKSVDKSLVSAFVERWHPETNTFQMPFGEMTITLDDVATILGIPVTGITVSYNDDFGFSEAKELLHRALGVRRSEAHDELAQVRGHSVRLEWLKNKFDTVTNSDGEVAIDRAVRAYLLYIFGYTLFSEKSGTCVSVIYLHFLMDVDVVASYAWGAATLAYLYRHLGLATRYEVKQIAGYLSLLEAWIYEHFPCFVPNPNLMYIQHDPRALLWQPSRESNKDGRLQSLREIIDEMGNDKVTWDPYRNSRQQHPLYDFAFYSGCIRCLEVMEPYHPERVLRQFGRLQPVPPAPLTPDRAHRGLSAQQYQIAHQWVDQQWQKWENHVLSPANRSRPIRFPSNCVPDYMSWYTQISWRTVQNPRYRSRWGQRNEASEASTSANYEQHCQEALSIAEPLIEADFYRDPQGMYANVDHMRHVLRGLSFQEAQRIVRDPNMTSSTYTRRSRSDRG